MDVIEIVQEIDQKAVEFFENEPQVLSIFVVGSMYDLNNYKIRRNNDYDIRLLVNKVTPNILTMMDIFQKHIVEMFTDENIQLGYSNLVGAVNHNLSDKQFNLLLHFIVHEVDDLSNFLPLTHQVQYGKHHRLLYGQDYLGNLCKKFEPMYLIDCHEGIDYCIDMLNRDVYKYLIWETETGEKIEFKYCEIDNPDEMVAESVFYSLKNVLNNLYESIVLMNDIQGVLALDFYERLCDNNAHFMKLIECVESRDEKLLYSYGNKIEIFNEAIKLLQFVREKIISRRIVQ